MHPDWAYLGALVAADVGSIYYISVPALKNPDSDVLRQVGPALVGLTFGATIGGAYLALPKCDPHWVPTAPREGNVRATWPLALTLALVGGMVAPVALGIATGPQPPGVTTEARALRFVVAGGCGFGGAVLPYLLPPKTWRAAKELERIRAYGSPNGAFLSYSFEF